MINVLYVHGIGSAGGGNTVELFKKYFPYYHIDSPDIPENPNEAITFLRGIANNYDIVIGTSLGGFYAMQLFGPMKILINPAMDAPNSIANIGMGEHPYFKHRKDGKTTYIIDTTYIDTLKKLYNEFFNNCFDFESKLETYAIFGNNDTVCNCQELFKEKYYKENMVTADFGHRMTEEVFVSTFIPLFNNIVKKLEEN